MSLERLVSTACENCGGVAWWNRPGAPVPPRCTKCQQAFEAGRAAGWAEAIEAVMRVEREVCHGRNVSSVAGAVALALEEGGE